MTLGELIDRLSREPAGIVCRPGFGRPDSYRGYYEQIAFEPRGAATIGEMLGFAKSALGRTFTGYKGGNYRMGAGTIVNIAAYGCCDEDDEITSERLESMILGAGQ